MVQLVALSLWTMFSVMEQSLTYWIVITMATMLGTTTKAQPALQQVSTATVSDIQLYSCSVIIPSVPPPSSLIPTSFKKVPVVLMEVFV